VGPEIGEERCPKEETETASMKKKRRSRRSGRQEGKHVDQRV
jgi:hypothetical protein